MGYTLPFNSGQSLIELGGGSAPVLRPNLDVRPGPSVDIVADLSEKLPLETDAYDGVYCSYALEHVSWRKVPAFLSEVARVLKPGGRAVFVTSNTKEQMRWALSQEEWDEKIAQCIFGDNDYPENTHRAAFSPDYAFRLFRAAGFEDILILPHGELRTDMVIEAKKAPPEIRPEIWTPEERKLAYNRHYFDGGRGKVGGYSREGYWDYPVHWKTFEEIMARKPESVLEIGAARGYVLKRLEDSGVRVKGLEVSDHCRQTRVIEDLVTWDVTETPWPVGDKEFDLVFSMATLEHIPEAKIPDVAREMDRVAKRGLHGIDFGHHDDGFDKTHVSLHDRSWWKERLPEPHEIVDKEDLEKPPIPIPQGDGKLKLNVGSFTTMFHHGWTNMDVHDLDRWARQHGFVYRRHDVRSGLPYEAGRVDMIYACHFLEHLDYRDGMGFLKECARVLRPGSGLLRLLLPDAAGLMEQYRKGTLSEYDELNDGCASSSAQVAKLWSLLFSGHNSMYDWETLRDTLSWAGFSTAEKTEFRKSRSPQMLKETQDMYPTLSLFVEASK
jgi:predicted SAM-dependent methyltransferase